MTSRRWILLVAALSLLPVLELFTTHRIFFVRDLSFFFWSRHLWLRHTLFAGEAPWWDPHVAAGQSAIADALNQLLMPITLAVRLLPSDVVSFNLWVALPLPVAAVGTFVFLRRGDLPAPAAALGASIFALSGPMVSMLNAPNLSWSVALLPWVLWSLSRGMGTIAVAYALQALCGEPVTWVATGLLAAMWIFRPKAEATYSSRPAVGVVRLLAGLASGALLAAPQLVPTLLAGMRAQRGALATPDFWSLHPVALWDAVAPQVFGNYYDAFIADLPWMAALNFGRDPFFYSLYIGPIVLLLAAIGGASSMRRNGFWVVVALVAVVAALGGYTPFYPLVRKLVPQLMYFRFPVKYLAFAVFAVAVLAAEGWAAIAGAQRHGAAAQLARVAAVVGMAGLLLCAILYVAPEPMRQAARWLATSTHLKDADAGAAFLARTAPPLLLRGFALLLAGSVLLLAAERRSRILAALFAAVCADLAITNGRLNLTMDAGRLSPPPWYTEMTGEPRIYIGGRLRGYMNTGDRDAVREWQIPAEQTAIEGRMLLNAQLPMAPSGWRVREALSYDLPYLWPAEYEATLRRFEEGDADERAAFLRRSGVRRCVLPATEPRPFARIAEVSDWNMSVFECGPDATRVFLAPAVEVASAPDDLTWQRDALFNTTLPDAVARVPTMPAAAGRAAAPEPPSVRIVHDGGTAVVVEAALDRPGLVVLRDTYDPSWRAEVDGEPAEVVRVNGRYRGVALAPGRHVIRFHYRPRDFATGLIVSMITAAAVGLVGFSGFRSSGFTVSNPKNSKNPKNPRFPAGPAAGFTLIELMIVLAVVGILLAIAFNQYRGMQARGNEASAIGSLRAIAAAQWQFALTCGNMKYATVLPDLAKPAPSTNEAFLSPDLTSADTFEKSGYIFRMTGKPDDEAKPACNGAPVADGYAATADPVRPGVTGTYYYGVNADRVLYVDEQGTYTENLPESGAASHGVEVK